MEMGHIVHLPLNSLKVIVGRQDSEIAGLPLHVCVYVFYMWSCGGV